MTFALRFSKVWWLNYSTPGSTFTTASLGNGAVQRRKCVINWFAACDFISDLQNVPYQTYFSAGTWRVSDFIHHKKHGDKNLHRVFVLSSETLTLRHFFSLKTSLGEKKFSLTTRCFNVAEDIRLVPGLWKCPPKIVDPKLPFPFRRTQCKFTLHLCITQFIVTLRCLVPAFRCTFSCRPLN